MYYCRSTSWPSPCSAHSVGGCLCQLQFPMVIALVLVRLTGKCWQVVGGREERKRQDILALIFLLRVTSLWSQLLTNSCSPMSQLPSNLLCHSEEYVARELGSSSSGSGSGFLLMLIYGIAFCPMFGFSALALAHINWSLSLSFFFDYPAWTLFF